MSKQKIDYNRRLQAIRHGQRKLYRKLKVLEDQIAPLKKAHTEMVRNKWVCESKLVAVTHVPKGMGKKIVMKLDLNTLFSQLSAEKRAEIVKEFKKGG